MSSVVVAGVTRSAEYYRDMAKGEYRQADDSFERCDTDGFVSQWANDITGRAYLRAAEVAEDGGFLKTELQLLDGTPVDAKLIDGRYGVCWALLDGPKGKFTGTFVSAFPVRESTMARKGFREAEVLVPAEFTAVVIDAPSGARGFSGATSCFVACRDMREWN